MAFIDSFSVGLDGLPRKEINHKNVLKILNKTGRFSCFEASDNQDIASFMTALCRSRYIEIYTPDCYKAKPEPGGAIGCDQGTYPWTYVRVTDDGKRLMNSSPNRGGYVEAQENN